MTLSIATLNILDDLTFWPERAPLIAQGFDTLRPDVIALQEVSLATAEGPLQGALSNAHWLAERLGGYSVVLSPRAVHPASDSLAVLTSSAVVAHQVLDLGAQGRRAQRVDVQHGDERWTIVNTHLYWNPIRESVRVRQADQVLSWLHDAYPVVVCGDLNALPGSATLGRLGTRFASAHRVLHGEEPRLTYPTLLRRGRGLRHDGRHLALRVNGLVRLGRNVRFGGAVDYIMVDRGVRVGSARVILDAPSGSDRGIFASDHVGLHAVLEHPGEP